MRACQAARRPAPRRTPEKPGDAHQAPRRRHPGPGRHPERWRDMIRRPVVPWLIVAVGCALVVLLAHLIHP